MKHLLKKILTLKNMKTSNKLLITLAVSLIIIPIIVIAVNVKMNYKDKKTFADTSKSDRSFSTASEGFKSKALGQFTAVNVGDANDIYLNVKIIKSDKFGIKVPEDLEGQFGFEVDDQGTLQITLKNGKERMHYSPTILIYAGNISKISVAKAGRFELDINSDSLILNAKDVKHLTFETNSILSALELNADHVEDIALSSKGIDMVNANLRASEFKTGEISYKILNIVSAGQSKIEISGDEKDVEKYVVDQLKISTTGKTLLSVGDIKVNNISGSLSDSTMVEMPAIYLKKMLKN
jgi:hypothetical protein